jgi:hypothetical protein
LGHDESVLFTEINNEKNKTSCWAMMSQLTPAGLIDTAVQGESEVFTGQRKI